MNPVRDKNVIYAAIRTRFVREIGLLDLVQIWTEALRFINSKCRILSGINYVGGVRDSRNASYL